MTDLHDPDSPDRQPNHTQIATAELEALATSYRQQAAGSTNLTTMTTLNHAAGEAECRAEVLRQGARPHV